MLVEEFDNIEEVIFGVMWSHHMERPESLFSDGKEHFKFDITNNSVDMTCIHALVSKCLMEIPVFTHLVEDPNEKVNNIG